MNHIFSGILLTPVKNCKNNRNKAAKQQKYPKMEKKKKL